MRRLCRGSGSCSVLVAMLLLAGPLAAQPAVLGAGVGLGFDRETGEESPTRIVLGLELDHPRLRSALVADCGIPWEPSASLSLDVLLLDRDALRLALDARFWLRAYGDLAVEGGAAAGVGVEAGPRRVSVALAGGIGTRSTRFAAIDDVLGDVVPWARLGAVARPVDAARLAVAIGSDAPLALWLRTSFELSGSWRFPSGVRIEGLLAARYSDFFTLTAHLDSLDARAFVVVPLAGGPP